MENFRKWEEVFGRLDFSRFSPEQQTELMLGIDKDLPVQFYANPDLTPTEMHELCGMLETLEYVRTYPNEKVVATGYGPEPLERGFHSETNFEYHPERVCYIPDNWVFDKGPGLTGKDFLDLCDGDRIKARMVFDMCTWQFPGTILDEWDHEDEMDLLDRKARAASTEPKTLSELIHAAEQLQQSQIQQPRLPDPYGLSR